MLALVYLRAPGWPVGLGDEVLGLENAHRAVEVDPEFPDNQLTLAEALAETGDHKAARAALERGKSLARSGPWDEEVRNQSLTEAERLRKRYHALTDGS